MEVAWCRRPEVLTRLPSAGHVVLEASAGTGKTYALEHLVVELLLHSDLQLDQILVVTFTEKATEELRSRLRRKLLELSHLEPGEEPRPGEQEGFWRLDDEARERLRDALVRFDAATISTIHGFCQRVLTEQAFAHRRLFEQQLVDGGELFARAYREVLRRTLAADDPLSEPLQRWLRDPDGKPARLEEAVWRCVGERGEITPAAGGDLRQAIEAVLGVEQEIAGAVMELARASAELGPRTPSKIGEDVTGLLERCRSFLDHGDALALAAAFRDWSGGQNRIDRLSRLRRLLRADGEDPRAVAPLLHLIELLERQPADLLPRLAVELAARCRGEIEARKRSLGLFDFDDMLLQVREGLCGPDADPQLRAALRRQYRCALIDELQDTDPVQWEIFHTLFFDSAEGHRMFVVGDPKQAIYGFRGADVHTYLAAREQILASGGGRVPLDRSFRSTAPLVTACNRLFEGGFFTATAMLYDEVSCGRPELSVIAPADEEAPVHLIRVRGDSEAPKAAAAAEALGGFIAREVERLVAGRALAFGETGAEHPLRYRDIQVLTRTGAEGRRLGEALRRRGIPHYFYRQDGLFQTAEARDLLAVLRAVADPADPAARLAAWLTPFFGVPLGELHRCRELPEGHPLGATLFEWRRLAGEGHLPALLRGLARDSGLARRLLVAHQGERELTTYRHLLDLMVEEARRTPSAVGELADRLQALVEQRRPPAGRDGDTLPAEPELDAVQILTMHKVKGLQATVVFVAGGFTDGPHTGPCDLNVYHRDGRRHAHLGTPLGGIAEAVARERREEAQRLLYVAVTRARARVYLPYFGETPEGPGVPPRCSGTYRQLAERLETLVMRSPHAEPLFAWHTVRCEAAAGEPALSDQGPHWRPDRSLLLERDGDPAVWQRLREERRGAVVTSYTRLYRQEGTAEESGLTPYHAEPVEAPPALAEDELPRGRASGIFLHELLEQADRRSLLEARGVEDWRRRREVEDWLGRLAAAHAIEVRWLPDAARLTWAALRTPVAVDGLRLPRGFAEADRQVAEMEFLFPIPEPDHPRLGCVEREADAPEPAFRARHGFVQGVVDLVLEHGGRTFFLDWKSDLLARWGAADLEGHVAGRYDLQARLYALAVVRLLGITSPEDFARRFGGLFYCFVRGVAAAGPEGGLYFRRPSWQEVSGWERQLLGRREWR
jgi:exodeoxyribonuclease V beta subunit